MGNSHSQSSRRGHSSTTTTAPTTAASGGTATTDHRHYPGSLPHTRSSAQPSYSPSPSSSHPRAGSSPALNQQPGNSGSSGRDGRRASRRHHGVASRSAASPARPPPVDRSEVVDGGRVAPAGDLYHATHHYDEHVVRDLIRARRLAPFYAGLDDVDEDQVRSLAAAADRRELEEDNLPLSSSTQPGVTPVDAAKAAERAVQNAMRWIATVGGAVECPICFLYYPSNINHSACCKMPICSECFVQIKRPDATCHADCPYCAVPGFAITYAPPAAAVPLPPALPPTTLPTPPHSDLVSVSADSEPWPTASAPVPVPTIRSAGTGMDLLSVPSSGSVSRRASESDAASARPSLPLDPALAQSPPAAAAAIVAGTSPSYGTSFTITATTHTRPARSLSTSALAEIGTPPILSSLPFITDDPAATTVSFDTDAPANGASPPVASVDALSTTTATTAPTLPPGGGAGSNGLGPDAAPVTSDAIRPGYIQKLQQERQLTQLREHQDAAATRLRRLLFESGADPGTGTQPSTSTGHPGSSRRGSNPAAGAMAMAAALGMSRRQMERVYVRALGLGGDDLEEILVREAMLASLQDEEERTRRAQEEEDAATAARASGPAASSPTVTPEDESMPIGLLHLKSVTDPMSAAPGPSSAAASSSSSAAATAAGAAQ
ncbi:hypothetical protein BC828DRAFT_414128 [Blastocladiella britannica]|nr:hypothetical protein BC828DRAFT_414128 [Blastocladiella britannica]